MERQNCVSRLETRESENELIDAELSHYRGGMPRKSGNRVEYRDIEVESHWLKEVRLSAS